MTRPARTLGPYRLDAVLGRGGMGEVHRAYDQRLHRHVAIKRVRPADHGEDARRERFRREARAAASLTHPAIVQVFDILELEEDDWLVMELVNGRTLADELSEGPLAVDALLAYAIEIAGGLAAAHERGVVHRDLKTENVMITAGGHAKILDFGIAKQTEPSDSDAGPASREASLTSEGQVVGTARAMSPEQARGFAIDHRSDLFSLGTLLYEALTGVSPFTGATRMDTLTRVSTHRHVPMTALVPDADIPAALSALVDQLLEKAPELRPASADEVRQTLERIAAGRRPGISASANPRVEAGAATLDGTGDSTPASVLDRAAAVDGANTARDALPPERPARARRRRGWVLAALLPAVLAALVVLRPFAGPPEPDAQPSMRASYDDGMALLRAFHVDGNVDRAVAVFQHMLARDERSAPAHAGLARAYWTRFWSADESGDPMYLEQALAVAEQAVTLDEFLADARVSRGLVYTQLGRLDDAARDFQAALELAPEHPEAHDGAGRLYRNQARFEAAEAAFRRAIEYAPEDRRFHDDLGELYFHLGRYQEAEQAFAQSVALAPESVYGYRNLGGVYVVQGRYGDAANQFQRALAIRSSASLYSNLGTALFAQGLYSRSAAAFERVLTMDGAANFYLHWANLGDAYRHTPGAGDKAAEAYQRALQLVDAELERTPENPTLRSRRVLYLAKRGACQESRGAIDAFGAWEVAYVGYRLAVAMELCGLRERALTTLARALELGLPPAEPRNDPELRALRAAPGYHRMLAASAPASSGSRPSPR